MHNRAISVGRQTRSFASTSAGQSARRLPVGRGPRDGQSDCQDKRRRHRRAEQTPGRQAEETLLAEEAAVGLAEQPAPYAIVCSAARATKLIAPAGRTAQRRHADPIGRFLLSPIEYCIAGDERRAHHLPPCVKPFDAAQCLRRGAESGGRGGAATFRPKDPRTHGNLIFLTHRFVTACGPGN